MRDFVFLTKNDPVQKATLRVDIIDDKSENFTIMWIDGIEGTVFEKYFPWKLGEVITEDEIEALLIQFQPVLTGVKYGEDTVKTFGVEEHELTITPTITNGHETFIIVSCKNEYDVAMKKTVPLTYGVPTTVEIVEGFEYSFELIGADTWTVDAPEAFTCDGDKAVALDITKTIDLDIHTATITPTLVNGTTANVTMRGVKDGYETIDTPIVLETGVDVTADMYEGYSYTFILAEGDTWTSGAPSAIICDGDETVALEITVPISLPVHTLTITPTLTDATETSVMLIGTLAGHSSTNTPVNLEDGVDVSVDIYEGYSYEFALDSDDTWTGGTAPAAIVCDGDETVALAITVVTV